MDSQLNVLSVFSSLFCSSFVVLDFRPLDSVCILVTTPKEKLDKIGQPSLVLGLGFLIFRLGQAKRAFFLSINSVLLSISSSFCQGCPILSNFSFGVQLNLFSQEPTQTESDQETSNINEDQGELQPGDVVIDFGENGHGSTATVLCPSEYPDYLAQKPDFPCYLVQLADGQIKWCGERWARKT